MPSADAERLLEIDDQIRCILESDRASLPFQRVNAWLEPLRECLAVQRASRGRPHSVRADGGRLGFEYRARQVRPRAHAELAVDRRRLRADGMQREPKRLRDLRATQSLGEQARARFEAARASQAGGGSAPAPRNPEYSALCQALLLSGEFRTVD
jgi:hypothetical protein